MKYVITESKLNNAIYQYLDEYLKPNELNWTHGMDFDENGEYEEDENFIIFYKGDWDGEDDSDIVFNYFTKEYYGDEASSKSFKNNAPILEVMGGYAEHLDNMFGVHWQESMEKWFQDNINLPVNTLSVHY
jgi:hypothetical protein